MLTGCTTLFAEKWKKAYKTEPNMEELNNKIQNRSIRIQPHMVYWDDKSSRLVKILAAYWLIDLDVVVKCDLESRSAVTAYFKSDVESNKK